MRIDQFWWDLLTSSPYCRVQGVRSGDTFRSTCPNPPGRPLDVGSSQLDNSFIDPSAFASIIICEAVLIGLWFGDHGNVRTIIFPLTSTDARLYASMSCLSAS